MGKKKKGRDINGIIVINKPLGLSSNQVLQRVKRLFNANKAGHTGALDPQASGVLPICLGEATKFSQILLDSDKGYQTTATLGEIRSTGDAEGEVIKTSPIPIISEEQLSRILEQFRGAVEQVPPMFSALKLNGKPLYELARQGMSQQDMKAVAEKKRRTIHIHSLELNSRTDRTLDLSVRCSKGTYIRTLVEDIGNAMGCGAYVSRLHRTHSGPYLSEHMHSLDELEERLEKDGLSCIDQLLFPMETAIPENWPIIELGFSEAKRILQGQTRKTSLLAAPSVQLRLVEDGVSTLIGIGRVEEGVIRSQRLLRVDIPELL